MKTDPKARASATDAETAPKILARCGTKSLVQSAPGFLLVFDQLPDRDISRQLRTFDAEEWHGGIAGTYRRELAGFSEDSLEDAAAFLVEGGDEALACLDPDLLNVCGSNLRLYNWLHSTTPFRVRARLQALAVLPMLKWEFLRMDDATDRVRRRIDAGMSVWDAFLEIHPGRSAILRRLATAEAAPEAWRGRLAGLLEVLDPLPPEKVPGTGAAWNAFHSLYLGLRLDEHNQFGGNEAHRAVKQRWLAECAALGWEKAYARVAAMEGGIEAMADTFDFLDELGEVGDWLADRATTSDPDAPPPWHEWRERSRERWLRAPQRIGLFRLCEASIRWHRTLWGNSEISDTRRDAWPRLLPQPVQLTAGIEAVFLCDAQQLAAEGRRLRHCVGGYWRACFLGESHIVSLRDRSGNSLSTLEIRTAANGARRASIAQHRAEGNATPSAELRALEYPLLSAIERGADFKALAVWRRDAEKIDRRISELEGEPRGNLFSPARFERVAQALGRDRLLALFADEVERSGFLATDEGRT